MSLFGMLRGLSEARIRYVVIGGVAATAHGSSRVTNDLDICCDGSPDNRDNLARLLVAWNARLRDVDADLPFILDARTLADLAVLTLVTDEGDLDVFREVAGVGDYDACHRRSELVDIGEVSFAVLSLPALIAAKREAGRKRDLDHLVELEALLELKRPPRKRN